MVVVEALGWELHPVLKVQSKQYSCGMFMILLLYRHCGMLTSPSGLFSFMVYLICFD